MPPTITAIIRGVPAAASRADWIATVAESTDSPRTMRVRSPNRSATERAEDQGDGQSKFFARWLRIKENCVGYRNEWERERFLFICTEPADTAFASSHQRNLWP